MVVGLCVMCDTALIVGLCVTQLCLPALPGGGVHRGVTTGVCFDCWSLYDTVPGDGVHRGVAPAWCFVSHSFAILSYLETVYAEVLQLVYVLIVGVCVTNLRLLVFVSPSFAFLLYLEAVYIKV